MILKSKTTSKLYIISEHYLLEFIKKFPKLENCLFLNNLPKNKYLHILYKAIKTKYKNKFAFLHLVCINKAIIKANNNEGNK